MELGTFGIVLVASALHAAWNVAARKVQGNAVVFWLSLGIAALLCLPFAAALTWSRGLPLSALPYMLATGIIHALYFGLLAHAYEHGEVSVVYPVARGTGVAGTPLLAYVLIKEHVSVIGSLGIIVIVLGIVLLGVSLLALQKKHHTFVVALLVGSTIIGYSVLDKVAVGRTNPVIYVCGMFFVAAVFLTPYVLFRHSRELRDVWRNSKRYIFSIGPASLITYLLILFAFRVGKVSYIVAAREFSVVLGAILGFAILGEKLTWRKALGIAAVTLGVAVIKMA